MVRLRRDSLSTKDSEGRALRHEVEKDVTDRECEVEEIDESAVVRFAGGGI